jgi:hypothetical protein
MLLSLKVVVWTKVCTVFHSSDTALVGSNSICSVFVSVFLLEFILFYLCNTYAVGQYLNQGNCTKCL